MTAAENASAFERPDPKKAHSGWRRLDKRKIVVGAVLLFAAVGVFLYAAQQLGRDSAASADPVQVKTPEEARVRERAAQKTTNMLAVLASAEEQESEGSAGRPASPNAAGRTAAPRQPSPSGDSYASGNPNLSGTATGSQVGASRRAALDSLRRALRRQLARFAAGAAGAPGQGRYQALLQHAGASGLSRYSALGAPGPRGVHGPLGAAGSRPRGWASSRELPAGVTAKPIVFEAEAPKRSAPAGAAPEVEESASDMPAYIEMMRGIYGRGSPAGDLPTGAGTTGMPGAGKRIAGRRGTPGSLPGGKARKLPVLRPEPPSSPFVLRAGTVIPAILETAVSSNLPGYVRARVTRNIYDSATQQHLLIPRGSVLQGHYDAQVRTGQKRLAIVWERLILPDGSTIDLPTFEAKAGEGRSGVPGDVDNHYWRIFGGALLTGLTGAAIRLATYDGEVGLFRRPSPTAVAGQEAARSVGRAADQLLRRQMQIQPTIHLQAGDPLLVYVSRKIIFASPYRPYDGFRPGR